VPASASLIVRIAAGALIGAGRALANGSALNP
jgi:hypothetical protein